MPTKPNHLLDQVNDFLDRYVLPWPVRFLTYRFVILATILLLIPLILFTSNTVFILTVNSYLNTMSVAVSSIVLLYATISEARQKQIAGMQEKRAQEDHAHVTEMHNLILQTIQNQNEELDELKSLIASLTGKEMAPEKQVEMPDLASLHPRGKERFAEADLSQRWEDGVHHNTLVSTLREDHTPCKDDKAGD